MVALGDSYASGPLVPHQMEQPWGCLRSSNNYAHQVARELGLSLVDATCSGADTDDMWKTHGVSPEAEFAEYGEQYGYEGHPGNPPQLDQLAAAQAVEKVDIVTLQIGGNDIGFGSIATDCGEDAVQRKRCADRYWDDDNEIDTLHAEIDATEAKIAKVLERIKEIAPDAEVYVLGYPGIFRIGDEPNARGEVANCAEIPAPEEDAIYLRDIQERLNAMIQRAADRANGSTFIDPETGEVRSVTYADSTRYVDIYTPSKGHTACDAPAFRWVEPIVPVNAAAPVHPNLGGMTAIADILQGVVWPTEIPMPQEFPSLPAPPASPAPAI